MVQNVSARSPDSTIWIPYYRIFRCMRYSHGYCNSFGLVGVKNIFFVFFSSWPTTLPSKWWSVHGISLSGSWNRPRTWTRSLRLTTSSWRRWSSELYSTNVLGTSWRSWGPSTTGLLSSATFRWFKILINWNKHGPKLNSLNCLACF